MAATISSRGGVGTPCGTLPRSCANKRTKLAFNGGGESPRQPDALELQPPHDSAPASPVVSNGDALKQSNGQSSCQNGHISRSTASAGSAAACTSAQSSCSTVRVPSVRPTAARMVHKARRVRFLRNGDLYFKGLWYALSLDRMRSFTALMEDLTRIMGDLVQLPHGVRHIFTIDGQNTITDLDDFVDGESYVCASSETFKPVDYDNVKAPIWNYSNPKTSTPLEVASLSLRVHDAPVTLEANEFIYPRIVTIIRNGVRPRKVVRLLLNRRTAPTFDQVLADITVAVKLDSGVVRRVFTLDGNQVTGLVDFFREDDVFIAYGTEKMTLDDFYLDTRDTLLDGECKASPAFRRRFLHERNAKMGTMSRAAAAASRGKKQHRPSVLQQQCAAGGAATLSRAESRRADKENAKAKDVVVESALVSPSNGDESTLVVEADAALPSTSQQCSSAANDDAAASPDPAAAEHPMEMHTKFKFGRMIGDGNFAVVFECTEKASGGKVALKVIDKEKCVGKEEMIENEATLMRHLRHDNIVEMYQIWDLRDRYYIALELVPMGDLFDALLHVRCYDERSAAGLMRCLGSALHYLHSNDIAHRDVKPENLLLYRDSQDRLSLKLADFGLATRVDRLLYNLCGTPTYVAPEILSEVGYGVKVDVWAAGAILYIMLCGFPPFISMDNNQEELFDMILEGHYDFPPPYWDCVSNAAKGLVQGMLQLQPDDRYSSEELLMHPWITTLAHVDAEYEELSRTFVEGTHGAQYNKPAGSHSNLPAKSSHGHTYGAESAANCEFFFSRRRSADDLSTTNVSDTADIECRLSLEREIAAAIANNARNADDFLNDFSRQPASGAAASTSSRKEKGVRFVE